MAKVIPNFCRSDSPGEKILFDAFIQSNVLQESIILHSLNIAKHLRNAEGEADFVILMPNKGILVLEVKHHSTVKFSEGKWYLGNHEGTTRGPLEQASEAMYSIREYLKNQVPESKSIPMYYFSWFTKATFNPPESIEWEPWQILSKVHLGEIEKWVNHVMDASINHLKSARSTAFLNSESFDRELALKVAASLRPNFETFMTEKENRSLRREELGHFITEQFECLDNLEENMRTLTTGPAGTGKTLLALEKLKRVSNANSKSVLVCFNRNLANSLSQRNPNLEIVTISSLIATAIKNVGGQIEKGVVPTHEIDGPAKFDLKPIYENIVIDEAQDVFTSRYLPWLDSLLIGGLQNGNWHAFGDFKTQKLYNTFENEDLIQDYSDNFARGTLKVNCRNLEVIGKLTYSLVPNAPKWKTFLRLENQVDPNIHYLPKNSSIITALDASIEYFKSQAFSYDDIIILSPSSITSPEQIFHESEYASKFQSYGLSGVGKIRFSTIHGFKGLESPCIALIELYELQNMPDKVPLMYIALTRATDRLFIVADPDSQKIMEAIANGGV
jgi:DNA replication protein DnaC